MIASKEQAHVALATLKRASGRLDAETYDCLFGFIVRASKSLPRQASIERAAWKRAAKKKRGAA